VAAKNANNQGLKGVSVNDKDFMAEGRLKNAGIAQAGAEVDNVCGNVTPSAVAKKSNARADRGA
jgi:hypothetical protein